jgi:hypothetical protein
MCWFFRLYSSFSLIFKLKIAVFYWTFSVYFKQQLLKTLSFLSISMLFKLFGLLLKNLFFDVTKHLNRSQDCISYWCLAVGEDTDSFPLFHSFYTYSTLPQMLGHKFKVIKILSIFIIPPLLDSNFLI